MISKDVLLRLRDEEGERSFPIINMGEDFDPPVGSFYRLHGYQFRVFPSSVELCEDDELHAVFDAVKIASN